MDSRPLPIAAGNGAPTYLVASVLPVAPSALQTVPSRRAAPPPRIFTSSPLPPSPFAPSPHLPLSWQRMSRTTKLARSCYISCEDITRMVFTKTPPPRPPRAPLILPKVFTAVGGYQNTSRGVTGTGSIPAGKQRGRVIKVIKVILRKHVLRLNISCTHIR